MRTPAGCVLIVALVLLPGCKATRIKSDDEKRAEARVDACISAGKDLANCEDGTPGMWIAAAGGSPDAVEKLLEKGAKPDVIYKHNGETPLYEAAKRQGKGYVEVVRLLLKAGADPNRKLAEGTPFFKAAGNPNSEVLALMLAHGADLSVRRDVGFLVSQGTVLHYAAVMGLHENVDLLLKAGMDKAVLAKGHTALDYLDKVPPKFKESQRGTVATFTDLPVEVVDYDKTRALLAN